MPSTSSYSSSGFSPTVGANPYEISSSEDGRVPQDRAAHWLPLTLQLRNTSEVSSCDAP
jgi:hypothetical protein